jgi:Leucine-rich repeat (LRR) protein
MGNIVELDSRGGSITSWTDLQKATSLRELSISGDSDIESMAFTSGLTSLTELKLTNCENLTVDGFSPLIALVNLKRLDVLNGNSHPRSIAVDLLSEVARRTRQLPAGSFQLKTLHVDSISAVLVAPICSLLAATLRILVIMFDQRVESLTEEEEKSLQLLTSLRILDFGYCPGLPSLPQGLHSLSSLRELRIEDCPEIQSLPNGGLPSSLNWIYWTGCSDELGEEVTKLKGTNPKLRVYCSAQSKTYHLFFFSRRNPLYSYYILTCET